MSDEQSKDVSVDPAKFSPLSDSSAKEKNQNLDLILDIKVGLSVEIGRNQIPIKDVLELGPGSVLELDKLAGEPVDILVNNAMIAKGEVVVINENFGVRITEIIGASARIQQLGAKEEA